MNEAKVTLERSVREGKGRMPEKKRTSWIVPVDVLLGDENARITRGREVKHGVGYGDFSTGSWVSVSLTCNQDDNTLRKAVATASSIVEKIITREDARLGKIADEKFKEIEPNEGS